MTSVLLVAPMPVGRQRTGPAIRCWELARVLSADAQVTLLVPEKEHPSHPAFAVLGPDEADLDSLLERHQIVVVQETEYTGAGKHPLAQLNLAKRMGIEIRRGDPKTSKPGQSIVIPE